MDDMIVATCRDCRAWYAMDFEEGIDNVHYDMRTGELCTNNNDERWMILVVPHREDWDYAN